VNNWAKGTSIPSDKLALLSEIGFDVQYIITGKRCHQSKTEIPFDEVTKSQLLDTLEIAYRNSLAQQKELKAAIDVIRTLKQIK